MSGLNLINKSCRLSRMHATSQLTNLQMCKDANFILCKGTEWVSLFSCKYFCASKSHTHTWVRWMLIENRLLSKCGNVYYDSTRIISPLASNSHHTETLPSVVLECVCVHKWWPERQTCPLWGLFLSAFLGIFSWLQNYTSSPIRLLWLFICFCHKSFILPLLCHKREVGQRSNSSCKPIKGPARWLKFPSRSPGKFERNSREWVLD